MSDYDGSDYDDDQPISSDDPPNDAKKHAREQHNALERRRRDNIKDMYTCLRDVVPDAKAERQASRAVILKKAIDTIQQGQTDNNQLTQEINELDTQNARLKEEIERLKNQKDMDNK